MELITIRGPHSGMPHAEMTEISAILLSLRRPLSGSPGQQVLFATLTPPVIPGATRATAEGQGERGVGDYEEEGRS